MLDSLFVAASEEYGSVVTVERDDGYAHGRLVAGTLLYLHDIYTAERRRRHGVARQLLHAMLSTARDRGAERFAATPVTEAGVRFLASVLSLRTVERSELIELPIEDAIRRITD